MKLLTIGLGLLVSVFSISDSRAQSPESVTIGTTSSSSSLYAYYAAMADLADDMDSNIQITVAETGGTEENIARLSRDQMDAVLVVESSLIDAYEGTGPLWDGNPQKQLRMLNLYYVAPQAFVVRKDSGVESLSDLDGKSWSAGHRGSGSENATMQIMEALDLKPEYYRGSLQDIVSATKNNEIVGFSKGLPGFSLDATMIDLQSTTDFQILGFSEDEQSLMKEKLAKFPLVDLDASLAQTDEPIVTWSFLIGTAASADMSDEAAYQLTRIADEGREEIGATFRPAGETDLPRLTLEKATVPLHPGAIRYFEEKGYDIPDRLVPSE